MFFVKLHENRKMFFDKLYKNRKILCLKLYQQWVTMPLLFKISKALDYDFFKECSEWFEEQRGK